MATAMPYSRRLRQLAQSTPDATALILESADLPSQLNYREYDAATDRTAAGLAARGVDKQSAVILVSPNSTAAVLASSGAWRLGAFVAPISFKSSQADLNAAVDNVSAAGLRPWVLSDHVRPEAGTASHLGLESIHDFPDAGPVADGDPFPARAIPSGGTTGRAKLIVDRTPWGHYPDTGIAAVLGEMGWHEARSVLVYSPLYHNVGQTLTHLGLMGGKKVVLMDRFDAARVPAIIARHRVEFFFAVPTHIHRLLALQTLDRDAFSSVRSMYHAGAYCAPDLKRRWLEFLGPERVWELYGATDGPAFTLIRGDEWLAHPGSVGKPRESEITILDENHHAVPAGEVGSIYMKSAFADADEPGFAYLGDAMPHPTDDGYRTVGDMGWLDDAGYLHIADRRTDMIISGGANVFPAEVEAALCRHPGVAEVAVVGIPDAEWGRRVHAVIVPTNSSPSPEDLNAFMADELVAYKKPRSYEFRSSLMYTDVDKLDRKALTEDCCDKLRRVNSKLESR